ncbi:transmembrane protein, putative (macronuclear) [Tetrahymena thermophila SB210]|uniref:Transmembrane protein, putative n=1 Tax=Tetrahymena thermophila (strain SB210) TaxID=312017 RepID=Q23KI8_TETTS|nr:transmembrane protein, putative [Tetrahymena thermophila SB210]EAR96855.2 transmembrane protein, putative [Tetrahymena thermophila SB210]|eukprot:XP_001017100.2 transmembrane protein, putative [Tetrahymena thermophila SB210]
MYDEKIEIQKIFNRMKPFKVKKVDQNNLIHLLKHMKVLQNMVFSKDHTFKVDDSVIIKIDIQQDVDQSKLQLDCIFKSIIEDNPKSEVAEIHKQLGTVLQNIVKKMEQIKKEEEEERLRKEAEEKRKQEEEEKKKKKEQGIESEDEEEKDQEKEEEDQKNKKPNPKDLFKRQFDEKDLTIEKEQEYNIELEQKLLESVEAMKWIAKGILIDLGNDEKVRESVRNKQDDQINQVKDGSHKIDQFLSNKDLSLLQLIFMLLISIGLTIFTIVFIHIW